MCCASASGRGDFVVAFLVIIELNLAFAELEPASSSELSSKAANKALTFEFGVNCTGELGEESLPGDDSLEEAILDLPGTNKLWRLICRRKS